MQLILTFILLFAVVGCSKQNDIIFSASDELHSIYLYKNKEFNMLYNGLNTVQGYYEQRNDTIFLTYLPYEYLDADVEGKGHASEILTSILVLDKRKKRIHSINGKQFCAGININLLK